MSLIPRLMQMEDIYDPSGRLTLDGEPVRPNRFELSRTPPNAAPYRLNWLEFYRGRRVAYRPFGSIRWKRCVVMNSITTATGTRRIVLRPSGRPEEESFRHRFDPNERWIVRPLR